MFKSLFSKQAVSEQGASKKVISLAAGLTAISTAVFSGSVLAHTGPETFMASTFTDGLLHPLMGLDHFVMLLGVGFLAAQMKGKQVSIILGALVTMLIGTGFGALTGLITGMESLILASVFIVAVAVWKQSQQVAAKVNLLSSAAVVMVLFHGWAHGVEAPAAQLVLFVPGMLISAAALLTLGAVIGRQISAKWLSPWLGLSGVLVAFLGA
ncbi:HupE/UreJ family protein [Moritella viscosa]|uniref:Urease accessory protein UreJ n=1 Tax=Moritella viscosa TaxID=80854 RepID=A0ABY1H6T0_9GAMM|nr:HupE/UreJ family protein [Moritella viscosa]SGY82620.1 Urease accessory protein UreJ [Moritella viscosa]SGY83434.1 Urease accessory protein UreJ [Moritella viscosa]SHO24230.1 Urease accessory protein UreJ [Moritella viscosa]